MDTYEAALNRLREERLAVTAARAAITRDHLLKQEDPAHWRQLMGQTWREIHQLGSAIDVLGALQDGRLAVVEAPNGAVDVPDIPAQATTSGPRRDLGLVRKTPAIGEWGATV